MAFIRVHLRFYGDPEQTLELPTARDDNRLAQAAEMRMTGAQPVPRLGSLDAFRGAIMLLMASSGLGIAQVAKQYPDNAVWRFLGDQCEHRQWTGCSLWDLIQPSFMFMVGVALPWSVANRRARGQSFRTMFGHALWRALLLVVLAVFLTSAWSKQTEWVFTNVLAQIGLGYPFLFLLAFTRPRTQWLTAFGLLAACWLAFALYPLPPADFDWRAVGVPADWPHLEGLAAALGEERESRGCVRHVVSEPFPPGNAIHVSAPAGIRRSISSPRWRP